MTLTILGKRWRLRFVPTLGAGNHRGDCDPPTEKGKSIRIASGQDSESLMDTLIHEMLHAAGWNLDEEFVERFATDVARELTRLGYRKSE
jgi:hypothetical protein